MANSGHLLVVGTRAVPLVQRLQKQGYSCDAVGPQVDIATALNRAHPDAVVLSGAVRAARDWVSAIRQHPQLRTVPVVVDASRVRGAGLGALDVDAVARTLEALEQQLAASLKARRHAEREALERRRLELLLDVARGTAAGTTLEDLLREGSIRLCELLHCDGVAFLLLEDRGPVSAQLFDGQLMTRVDLTVSPGLRRAVEAKEPGALDDGLVVPTGCATIPAIVVRGRKRLEDVEIDLLDAVGHAMGHALDRDRRRQAEATVAEAMEAAYVDRFRELQEANQRLKAVDRKKNELLAVLSHDLRAPLNVLLGHAHLLLTDSKLADALKPSAEAVQRSGRKALELVEALLEKSRAEGGQVVLFTKTFDVAETCQETVRELQILARKRGIELKAEAPMELPILGDELKIRQVLQNLITNALEHARGAQRVTVRSRLLRRPDGDQARVEISDDGTVENPNELLLAFDRSSGLGLAICRDYVERHGGEIWAETSAQGGGLFAFTLPVKAAARPAPARDASTPLVLVAGHDPIFTRSASASLGSHYRVVVARDGDEALARVTELSPSAVVADVFMPRRDGLDVLRALRASPMTARVPFFLVSGKADLADRLRGLDLGAAELLLKPISGPLLVTRVSEALQREQGRLPVAGNDVETGLLDHLGLVNRLQVERARCFRQKVPCSVALLRPRAPVGARASEAAAIARQELGAPAVLGHLGSGVFCVVFPEHPRAAVEATMERLQARLSAAHLAYSTAVAEPPLDGRPAEAVLEQVLS